MWALLTSVPGLISGLFTTLNGITSAISNERIALINAKTDSEKAEIGERISSLQAQQAVLVADASKSNIDMWMRVGMALPPALYVGKIFFWDKTLGWGSTDGLTPQEWYLVYVTYGFYMVHSTVGLFK